MQAAHGGRRDMGSGLAGNRKNSIRIIESGRSLSTRSVLERRDQQTSGFAMSQKNSPSQAALVLIVDDDEATVDISG